MRRQNTISANSIFILSSTFILTIGQIIPIEIYNFPFKFLVYLTILIGFPIAIYKKLKTLFKKIIKVYFKILIILTSIYVIGINVIIFLFECIMPICNNSIIETLFIRKNFSFNTIVVREIGCGVYDSQTPKYEIINKINILSLIQIVPKIDTTKIKKEDWLRVRN